MQGRPERTLEEVKARRIKASHLRLERLEWQKVRMLDRLREKDHQLFAQLVCQGEQGIPFEESGIVLFRDDKISSDHKPIFNYLAGLVLRRLTAPKLLPDSAYVSLATWIESDMYLSHGLSTLRYGPESQRLKGTAGPLRLYVSHVRWKFFEAVAEALNWSVVKAAKMIYRGVPLFRRSGRDDVYSPVEWGDEDYVFLRQKGKRSEVTTSYDLPDWASFYYLHADHIAAYDAIFYSDGDLSNEDLELRRNILASRCGCPGKVSAQRWPWGDHETDRLNSLAAAAREWWSTYDPGNPSTAPTNEQVTTWLESKGESKRVAEVMAQILRADGLPTGPRK